MRRPSPLPPPTAVRRRVGRGVATPPAPSEHEAGAEPDGTGVRRGDRAPPSPTSRCTAPITPISPPRLDEPPARRVLPDAAPTAEMSRRRASGCATCGALRAPAEGAARRGAPVHGAAAPPAARVARGGGILRHPRPRHPRRGLQPAVRGGARSRWSERTQLDAAAVEQALADQLGTPLPLVDESAVKAALVEVPARRVVLARGPAAARTRRADRRAHPHRATSGRAPDSRWWMPRASPSRRRPTPGAGRPVLTVPGGTDSDAFERSGT